MDTINKVKMEPANMDAVDINQMVAYEEGALDDQETIAFFQEGISGGWIWQLQGHYIRTARALINLGYCTEPTVQQITPISISISIPTPTTPINVGATT